MTISPLHRLSRPALEEDLAAMRRDLEDVAAGMRENHEALTALERSVAELKADSTDILSILRGAR